MIFYAQNNEEEMEMLGAEDVPDQVGGFPSTVSMSSELNKLQSFNILNSASGSLICKMP